MKPISTIEVKPFLPQPLEPLRELAYNLRWTWNHEIVKLFTRLDSDLWQATNHNPIAMLGKISQDKLNKAASDDGFLNQLNRAYQEHQEYMKAKQTWFSQNFKKNSSDLIAYFSAEYGITEALAIYSGGLGILSGDHVKAASELGLPFVAVGLAYQEGYFKQYLNIDGWQQERYPNNDFYNLPLVEIKNEQNEPLKITVKIAETIVHTRIWKAQVGRVMLFLLDANVPENKPEDRLITNALYQANSDIRIKQEILLGIAGIRALDALGLKPKICHMNEGHSAFLALERINMLMHTHNLNFSEALILAKKSHIFTTHTAVPAGIDKFNPDLIDKYLSSYYETFKISREEFMNLGKVQNTNTYESNKEFFSMANLAINLSGKINAVSMLHQKVSAKLFSENWPETPIEEIPIQNVTNGIHVKSWISEELSELFDMYLGNKWSQDIFDTNFDTNVWQKISEIPDEELWRVHEIRRQKLVYFTRNRIKSQLQEKGSRPVEISEANEILDPQIFTIGFARRFATYKRANLLFNDTKRLAQILLNPDRPVQILISGKAHPEDVPAKEIIKQIINFTRNEDLRKRIVFIEDYDMNVARHLVQGVDMWLNTPIRFLEACGTSGMKVAFNGGLNCSILDGWWDEAYNSSIGWAIGQGEVYADTKYQDTIESSALYELLEQEILPMFYDRDKFGRPKLWVSKMKRSMTELCPQFNVNRMLKEYYINMYKPQIEISNIMLENGKENVKDLANFADTIKRNFNGIKILDAKVSDTKSMLCVGEEVNIEAKIDLNQLSAEQINVEIYYGLLNETSDIVNSQVCKMKLIKLEGKTAYYSGSFKCNFSGRHGYTIRVVPYHKLLCSPFDTKKILWAHNNNFALV